MCNEPFVTLMPTPPVDEQYQTTKRDQNQTHHCSYEKIHGEFLPSALQDAPFQLILFALYFERILIGLEKTPKSICAFQDFACFFQSDIAAPSLGDIHRYLGRIEHGQQ